MKEKHRFGDVLRKVGSFFGRAPYMRILAAVLALSIFFPLVPNPVAAEQAEKKKQAQHLLSALQQVIDGSSEEDIEENHDEEVEKTEDGTAPAEEQSGSDTEADEQQDDALPTLKKMMLVTPEGDYTLLTDQNGQLTAEVDDNTVKSDRDWSQMELSALVKVNKNDDTYSLSNDCLLSFLLTNSPYHPILASVKEGDETHDVTFYGLKTDGIASDEHWKDEDHDGVCDKCGRCLYGCSYEEELSYESKYPNLSFLMVPEPKTGEESDAFIYYVADENGTKEFAYTDENGDPQTVKYEKTLQVRRKQYYSTSEEGQESVNYYNYYIEDVGGEEVFGEKSYTKIAYDIGITVIKEDPTTHELTNESQTVIQYLTYRNKSEKCLVCNPPDSEKTAGCHMDMSSLRTAQGTLSSLKNYLAEKLTDENEKKTVMDEIDSVLDGIKADIALLEKLETAKETEEALETGLASFLASLGLSSLDGSLEDEETAKALAELTPEELVGTVEAVEGGVELNTDGSIYSDMKSVIDTYKAVYVKETTDQDARLLDYYPSYTKIDGYRTACKEKVLSAVGLILESEQDALKEAIASTIDPSDAKSVVVTPDEIKTRLTDELSEKTSTQLGNLLDQANNILSLIATVEATDEAYFLFLEDEKQPEHALKTFLTDCKTAVSDARSSIMKALSSAYTSVYAVEGVYATRKGTVDDIARGVGEDITVMEDDVEEIIKRLDGFLNSREFLLLVMDLFGDKIGFGRDMLEPENAPKGDLDGDLNVGLFDLLLHLLVTKVLTDETVTNLLGTVFVALNDFLDYKLDAIISGLKVRDNKIIKGSGGHYKVTSTDILKTFGHGTLGTVLEHLGATAQIDLYMNGAGGTSKLKDILSSFEIKIKSTKFADLLKDNGFTKAGEQLEKCGWSGLSAGGKENGAVLSFGISSAEDVQNLLSIVLGSLGYLTDLLFTERWKYDKIKFDINKLARLNITGSVLRIIPIMLDFNISPQLEISGIGLYNRVIRPVLEALGLDPNTLGNFSFTSIFQLNENPSASVIANALWGHFTDLLKNLLKAPADTLLSVFPNLAYYLQDGRLLSMLDYKTYYSFTLDKISAEPQGFKDVADRLWDYYFPHWYDKLNPANWIAYGIAFAAYEALQRIFHSSSFNLSIPVDTILYILNLDFDLPATSLDGLFSVLQKAIQKIASALGLYSNYTYKESGWGGATYTINTRSNLVKYLNTYAMVRYFLCSQATADALGFNLNDPMGILFTVLDSLYYDKDCKQKVFNLEKPRKRMLTSNGDLSLWKLASLGSPDGQRPATSSLQYYINGYAPDVLCYFLEVIACFFGEDNAAQNIKGLFHILGLNDVNNGSATLTKLHNQIQEKLGFGLDTLLGSCVTLKDGTVFLNADAIAAKTDFSRNSILCFLCEAFLSPGEYAPTEIVYAMYQDEVGNKPAYLSGNDEQNIWTNELAEALADDGFDLINDLLAAAGLDTDKTTSEANDLYDLIAALPTVLGGALKDVLGLPGEVNLADEQDMLTLITALLSKLSGVMQGESLKSIGPVLRTAIGTDLTEWGHDYAWLYEGGSIPTVRYFDSLRAEKDGEDILWKLDDSKVDSYEKLEKALSLLLAPIEPLLNLILCNQKLLICQYDGGKKNLITVGGCDGYNAVLLPLLEVLFPQEKGFLSAEEMKNKGGVAGTVYNLKLILNNLKDIFLKDEQGQIEDLTEMLLQAIYFFSGENGISAMLIDLLQPIWNLYDAMHPMLGIDLNAILNRVIYKLAYNFGKFEESEAEELQKKVDDLKLDIRTLSIPSLSELLSVLLSAKLTEETRVYFCMDEVYDRFLRDISRYSCVYTSKSTIGKEQGKEYRRLAFKAIDTGTETAMASGNAMTMMVSLLAEGLLAGKNCEILDGVTGFSCFTAIKQMLLGTYEPSYSNDYQWNYPEDSDAKESYEAITAKYLEAYEKTDWTDESLETLVADTGDVLNQLLNGSIDGKPLAETLAEALDVDAELLRSSGESGYNYTLDSVLAGIVKNLLNRYLSEESLNGLLLFVGDFLNEKVPDSEAAAELQKVGFSQSAALSESVAAIRKALLEHLDTVTLLLGALGIDLDAYRCDGYTVVADEVLYTALSEERSVRLTHDVLAEDYSNLGTVLAQVLRPFAQLFQFALLGTPIKALYTATALVDDRTVGSTMLSVNGPELYRYVLLPMMEGFGCEGLQSAAYYLANDDNLDEFLPDFFNGLLGLLTDPILDEDTPVLETLLDALASAVYYVNANGIGVSLKNLLAPLEPILGAVQDVMSLSSGEYSFGGGLLDDFTLGDIIRTVFAVLTVDENGKLITDWGTLLKGLFLEEKSLKELVPQEGIRLELNDTLYTLFDGLSVGGHEVDADASTVCGFEIQKVTYQDRPAELAKLLTLLTSGLMELIEDDKNAPFFEAVLGDYSGYYESVCNLFDLAKFKFAYPDLDWKFTEYADTDTLVSAFKLTEAFRDMEMYGENWTPEMADELGENLESFLNDVLYLLGLTVNGTVVRSIEDLTSALVGGTVYSDKLLNSITGLLGDLAALLSEGYIEGTSQTTAFDYLQAVLGVDLSSWMQYAPGGKYADGRSWGFTSNKITPEILEKNGKIFENALVELLSPIAPLLNILMANRDLSFLLDCDGAGVNHDDIQLTVYGAEGYKYAIIPLYEGLGIAQEEITDPDDYLNKALTDSDYAVRALVHPLISLINRMATDTVDEAMGILPKLIYFINSDGLGTFVKSLGHSLYVVAAALEPALETALGDKLVWEEVEGTLPDQTVQVPDVFATLQNTGLLDKLLEDLLGVTGEDILAIYLKTGVPYDPEVGYRSLDFNLLFSIGMAAVNKILADNGFALDISPLAADLVDELTFGYVRSFESLTRRTAYTMVSDFDGEGSSLGDIVSILMRVVLKFLSEEDNLEAILQFLKLKAGMSDIVYKACKALLTPVFSYLGTAEGMQNTMCLLYHGVYGASTLSGIAVDEYTNLNIEWSRVVAKLCRKGGPLATIALASLYEIAGDKVSDLVSPTEVAPNGLIPFVTRVVEIVTNTAKSIGNAFRKLFKR